MTRRRCVRIEAVDEDDVVRVAVHLNSRAGAREENAVHNMMAILLKGLERECSIRKLYEDAPREEGK